MALRRLKPESSGVIVAAPPVTANIIGTNGSTGGVTTVTGVSWLSEPNVNYKLCTSAPTFAASQRGKAQCRWGLTNANGSFTSQNPDMSGYATIGQEHVLCLTANQAFYGFSAFEYVLASGPTPPTWFSFGFQFWHNNNNTAGYTNIVPTFKAAADWPFLLWVEKL